MQAYVINLARSPERRVHMTSALAPTGQPYEIVEGVDGRELDLSDVTLVDPSVVRDGSFRLGAGGPGAAGCALGHLRVYRKVLEDARDKALVLEDDIIPPDDLRVLVEAVGEQMEGAEVVLLNFHSSGPCRVTHEASQQLPSGRQLVYPVDIDQPHSAGAYVITGEACRRMAELVLPVRVVADDWGFFARHGAIDRLRCVVPMPARNTADFRSTIDYYEPGSFQARVREAVARAHIPVVHQVLASRRRRALRLMGCWGDIEYVDERVDPAAQVRTDERFPSTPGSGGPTGTRP